MTIHCGPLTADSFRCPTKWELWRQILALLPRGRAWQTHEASADIVVTGQSSEVERFAADATALGAEPYAERLTTLQRYWLAYAELLEFLHQRACALLDEMFCASIAETRAEWGYDYGFPDQCEPWDALCGKVRAQGGATCAYLAELAARIGWHIECRDCGPSLAAAGCAPAGCMSLCSCDPNILTITIITALSPSATRPTPYAAGTLVAGCTPPCAVIPDQVRCLIDRFKPAHVRANYEVI